MARNKWIKVTGEDGTFYDYVMYKNRLSHLDFLREGGYSAEMVSPQDVPPCVYRDFSLGEYSYTEQRYHGGEQFYFRED